MFQFSAGYPIYITLYSVSKAGIQAVSQSLLVGDIVYYFAGSDEVSWRPKLEVDTLLVNSC